MHNLPYSQLYKVKYGAGAAILPSTTAHLLPLPSRGARLPSPEDPPVTRIHLTFAQRSEDGHMGARRFWRDCLPSLKYYNPAIPMTVSRDQKQGGKCEMHIFFGDKNSPAAEAAKEGKPVTLPTSSTTGQTHPPSNALPGTETALENVKTIKMQHKSHNAIWHEVQELTKAKRVWAPNQDATEMKHLAQFREQAEKDRARVAKILENKREQARVLKEAKAQVEALKADLV